METLDKHFRTLTKAAFEKHGFQSADLLSHWPDIVGTETAALCTPDRITWTRPKNTGETPTGTLTLLSAPGRALDVQYKAEGLRERINAYLGYAAIARIKVLPGNAVPPAAHQPGPSHAVQPAPPPDLPPALAAVEDPGLKDALTRLRHGILSEKPRSPQG
jgi:hypothetical protein